MDEEAAVVESGPEADQNEWPLEISEELFSRLVKTQVFTQSEGSVKDGTARLHVSISDQYMSGLAFARYMIALKFLVKNIRNQDLNFTDSKLLLISSSSSFDINWRHIVNELDKTGIEVDEETITQICEGDQANVDRLFVRIERYMKVICGSDFLQFEDVDLEIFKNLADLYQDTSIGMLENDSQILDLDSRSSIPEANFGMRHKSVDNSQETIAVNAPSNLIETRILYEGQQKPFKQVKEGVDIVTVQIDRPLSETENSLEFLLVTLSRAFQLSPRQSASLLTNNNQYLISACIKGIKGGSFEPLFNWYKELIANVQVLVELLRAEINQFKDQIHVTKVLSSISSGLYSQNEDIVKKTFNLLIECFYFFAEDKNLNTAALHWFLSTEDGGLKRAVYSLKLHADISASFVGLCNGLCSVDQQLFVLYKEEMMNHCKQTFDYIRIINEILEPLCNTKEQEVANCGLLNFWIEMCVRESENDGKHSVEERVAALSLLTQIWLNFQNFVSEVDERANSIIYMLKRACRDQNRCVKITTTAFLFKLLDSLSEQRNRSAPVIYKTLVFNLVENPSDSTVRELYLKNFEQLFKSQPSIPIALLLEPLLKQIQTQIGITYHLKTFDFDFFNFIAGHQKLSPGLAAQLVDFFSKLYLSEVTTCTAITLPFITIVKRFCEEGQDQQVERQVQNFVELALQQLFQIEEQLNLGPSPSGTYHSSKSSQQRQIRGLRQSANKSLQSSKAIDPYLNFKRQLIVTMMKRLQHISNEQIQQNISEQLRLLQTKVLQELDKQNNIVDTLLEFYGTSTLLVPKPSTSEPLTRPANSRASKARLDKQLRKISAEKPVNAISSSNSEKPVAVVPYVPKPISKNQANRLNAIQELENIRVQKAEKEEQKRQEDEKLRDIAEKKKQNLRKQIQKRRFELGVGKESDIPIAVLQKGQEGSEEVPSIQLYGVQWFDLEDEEDRDRDAFNLLMKKYARLWRLIFMKYANHGFKIKTLQERNSFEGLKQQQETISLAEVTKMMREYNIYPQLLGKEDLQNLMRLVNMKMGAGQLLTFDFTRYLVFITQASVNIYSKVSYMVYQTPQVKLQSFIKLLETVTRDKEQNAAVFDEISGGKDQEKLQTLNNRLNQDPNYPLPEGYIKYREKGTVYSYDIQEDQVNFIGEANLVCYSIVDDLMSKVFGFHVIEPKAQLKEQVKAKSLFQKATRSENQERGGDRYSGMKKATQLEPLVPKMSEQLIAMAAESKDPDLYFEIASILENVIQGCENQIFPSSQTQQAAVVLVNNKKPDNSAVQLQKEKEEQFRIRELSREKKRKERDAKIKQDLEKLKEQRAEKEAQLETQKKEQARADKLAEKKKQDAIRRSIQRIIDEAQVTKEKKLDTEDKRSVSNSNIRAKSKPPTKEQIERISGNHDQLMKRLQEQKTTLQQKEDEVRQKDIQLREQIKKKTEQALLQNKDLRQKDLQFQSQLQSFLLTEPVVQVFAGYNLYLEHIFKFYCSQGKIDLGVDMKFKQKHMDQKEFVKFGYQCKVVPVLITSDELIQMFKVLCKMHYKASHADAQSANLKSLLGNTIDFDTFKEAIVRICIYGHLKLGGQTDDQISYTQEVESARKQNETKIKDLMRKKNQERKSVIDTVLAEMRVEFQEKLRKAKEIKDTSGRSPSANKGLSQSRSEVSIGQLKPTEGDKIDEQEFQKWLKQQENIGSGLLKRVDQRMASNTDISRSTNSSSQVLLKQRQTIHQKQIERLESEALVKQRLGRDDIRDNRQVIREMDIKLISAATLEVFLTFIGAIEGDVTVAEMEQKFNAQKIEVQANKLTKNIKNTMIPKLVEMAREDSQSRSDSQISQKASVRPSPKPKKKQTTDEVIFEEVDLENSNRKIDQKHVEQQEIAQQDKEDDLNQKILSEMTPSSVAEIQNAQNSNQEQKLTEDLKEMALDQKPQKSGLESPQAETQIKHVEEALVEEQNGEPSQNDQLFSNKDEEEQAEGQIAGPHAPIKTEQPANNKEQKQHGENVQVAEITSIVQNPPLQSNEPDHKNHVMIDGEIATASEKEESVEVRD